MIDVNKHKTLDGYNPFKKKLLDQIKERYDALPEKEKINKTFIQY